MSRLHDQARDNKWLRELQDPYVRIYCDDTNDLEQAASRIAAVTMAPGHGLTLHRGDGFGEPLQREKMMLVPCRCPAGPHRVDHGKVLDFVDAGVRVARVSQVVVDTSTL